MGNDKQVEEIELWQITEVHINNNYARGEQGGRVYYSRVTSTSNLPESFWLDDWQFALQARERAERLAVSSGKSARNARGVYSGRLISQEIANNPSLDIASSSAKAAQQRRGKGKDKTKAAPCQQVTSPEYKLPAATSAIQAGARPMERKLLASAANRVPKSLAAAVESEDDELASLRYPVYARQFFDTIEAQRTALEDIICKLLQVQTCRIVPSQIWLSGSFNVAILVRLPQGKNAYLRLPLQHRIGEGPFPGNVDEKIRTETATYLWLQEHCKDVPIPTLYAFGLPNGLSFTHPQNTVWWRRVWAHLDRFLTRLLGRSTRIRYIRHPIHHSLPSGFLLISEAPGECLAYSWRENCHNQKRRENLFRGLSRISLSMNAMPQHRLGAFRLQDDDTLALSNRPLNLYMHMLENEGIPSGIPRGRTYSEVDRYLSDLLSLQDAKLRGQPNAIFDVEDGQRQLAASVGMRAVMHHFVHADMQQGLFYLTLTDLTPNNIFVDEQWNITSIIDLEWAHTLPAEMQGPPYWLTSKSIDGFYKQEDRDEFDTAVKGYLTVYEEEEMQRNGWVRQSAAQRRAWDSGGFWYFWAATVPKAMYNLFNWHVQPLFNEAHPDESIFDEVFFSYWGRRAEEFVERKLKERERYVQELTEAYRGMGIIE